MSTPYGSNPYGNDPDDPNGGRAQNPSGGQPGGQDQPYGGQSSPYGGSYGSDQSGQGGQAGQGGQYGGQYGNQYGSQYGSGQQPYGQSTPYGDQSGYGQSGYGGQAGQGGQGGQGSQGSYGDPGSYGQSGYGAQSGYGQPAPYGQPGGYGGYAAPREHPQGTTIMVLGIISLFVCFILGIVALVMGNKALREIDANPGAYTNRGSVQAGRICGIISIILQGLGVLVYVIAIIAIAASGSY